MEENNNNNNVGCDKVKNLPQVGRDAHGKRGRTLINTSRNNSSSSSSSNNSNNNTKDAGPSEDPGEPTLPRASHVKLVRIFLKKEIKKYWREKEEFPIF